MKLPIRKIQTLFPVTNAFVAVGLTQRLFPKSQSFRERCWALLLGKGGRLLGAFKVSEGGTDSCTIDGKLVCRAAIERSASGVILIHNHPGGNPKPSNGDIRETSRLREMLGVFGMNLLDHVIIGDGCFYSFSEERVQAFAGQPKAA